MIQRIAEMTEFFLEEQIGVVEGYDEQLVRRLFEKVTVYGGILKLSSSQ